MTTGMAVSKLKKQSGRPIKLILRTDRSSIDEEGSVVGETYRLANGATR